MSTNTNRNSKKSTKNGKKKELTPKQRAAKTRKRIIIFAIEILVLIIMLMVLWFATRIEDIPRVVITDEEAGINEAVEKNEVIDDYLNIALFGVDATNGALGEGQRTDTIMIASINQKTKEIKLVSVFRDTYLNLGNDTYNKINSAYATGGPKQAIKALNTNLDLNITNYVTVGYKGLIDTIDELGGIMIDVDSAELEHINNYIITLANVLNLKNTPVDNTGTQLLNGIQATAYCRIRYTKGDDFKRAERQREVLMGIIDKAKDPKNFADLGKIAAEIGPKSVSMSFDISEILDLLAGAASYEVIGNTGFPFEDLRTTGNVSGGSMVIPNSLEDNVYELHDYLFENETYEMSEDVKDYSKKIAQDTARYLN